MKKGASLGAFRLRATLLSIWVKLKEPPKCLTTGSHSWTKATAFCHSFALPLKTRSVVACGDMSIFSLVKRGDKISPARVPVQHDNQAVAQVSTSIGLWKSR